MQIVDKARASIFYNNKEELKQQLTEIDLTKDNSMQNQQEVKAAQQ